MNRRTCSNKHQVWKRAFLAGLIVTILSGLFLATGTVAHARTPSLPGLPQAHALDGSGRISGVLNESPSEPSTTTPTGAPNTVKLPFLGEVDVSSMPLYLMTAVISFVDGFNPCSLWLISLLLGIVVSTGSRKKVFFVGLTFLLVTTTVYGLFIVGLLNVFRFVPYMRWIQIVVAAVAFAFAAVNLKDYLWFKRGFSLTIPDRFKPGIFRDIRGIMRVENSTGAMVWGTALMAVGVAVVELPCTAGFPLIWTSIVSQQEVGAVTFGSLLALYLVIYVLDELGVVGVATVAMRSSRFEERHGRILKLIGGMIMLALGLVMLIKWEVMSDLGGILMVFGAAIGASLAVIFVHRKLYPRFVTKTDLGERPR
jgi:cytochrome c biogenesis protein CcdA